MLAKVISKTGSFATMLDLLTKLRHKSPKRFNQGFTLIELLVAMVIATLVITPLLGFMVDILNRDRIEQTKATSEAEIQAAIDYIAQDLEQAVYIYNASSLENTSTGIKDQIPPAATTASTICGDAAQCFPVLVFWKRETIKNILPNSTTSEKDDTFVYSLVAYYLIKNNAAGGTWSNNTARIGRFQIKDGVINPNDSTNYLVPIDQGYQGFNLNAVGATLSDKMNRWTKKARENYTNQVITLIDYVDKGTINSPIQNCPTNTQRVPTDTTIRGFYACVDSTSTLAQVYIRGNALARANDTTPYNSSNSAYFPTVSVQVKGRGFLGVN